MHCIKYVLHAYQHTPYLGKHTTMCNKSSKLVSDKKTAQQTDIPAYRPAIATKGKDAHKCKKDFSGWTSIAIVVVIVVTWIL